MQLKSELCDVALDLWRSFDESAVEEAVAVRCRDQERCDFRGPDIIQIPNDPEGCHRLVPVAAGFVGLPEGAF